MPVTRKERQHILELESSKEGERLDWLVQVIRDPQTISGTEKMNLRPRGDMGTFVVQNVLCIFDTIIFPISPGNFCTNVPNP